MKISVCIPMYNESSRVADTARRLQTYMQEHFEDYEIIFSNDGSRDGSAECVEALALPGVRVVGYPDNRGKGSAVRTAMLAATGDIVMFTDADLAYGLDVISGVYREFEARPEADLVIGSRNLHPEGYAGYTFVRKLASKVYIRLLAFVGGFDLSDSQCGMKGFRREAAERIFSLCEVDGFAFDFEVILLAERLGLKIHQMPVKIINHGESKVHVVRDSTRMLRDLIRIKKRVKGIKL